jgi:hypothetical protein
MMVRVRSLRIPLRMRRPSAAREALRFSPLVKARCADASRVKGVPLIAAGAKPFIFLAGRPAAERAADKWRLRLAGFLLLFKLAIWNNDRIACDRDRSSTAANERHLAPLVPITQPDSLQDRSSEQTDR